MCAKRRSGQTPPGSQRIGDRIFPIFPIRRSLEGTFTAIAAVPVFEEIDLALDFETYEVFDLYRLETYMEIDQIVPAAVAAADSRDLQALAALLEVPPVASAAGPPQQTALNLLTDNTWETDTTVITTHQIKLGEQQAFATAAGFQIWAPKIFDFKSFDFIQPYTIAANPALYLSCVQSDDDEMATTMELRATIWGRIRNASKEEFFAVNYRRLR